MEEKEAGLVSVKQGSKFSGFGNQRCMSKSLRDGPRSPCLPNNCICSTLSHRPNQSGHLRATQRLSDTAHARGSDGPTRYLVHSPRDRPGFRIQPSITRTATRTRTTADSDLYRMEP